MKPLLTLLIFLLAQNILSAQYRYDDNWVLAQNKEGILLSFSGDSLRVLPIPYMNMRMVEASVTMSDSAGKLQFYSNNCFIANAEHQEMDNGNDLGPGVIQKYYCPTGGNPMNQSAIVLPDPSRQDRYLYFHLDLQQYNIGQPGGSQSAPLHLLLSTVDMQENNGLGKLVDKNVTVVSDTLSWSALAAVRHANGRDWWLICAEYLTNCYYKILVDTGGVHLQDKQCIGQEWGRYAISGGTKFTENGSKFVRSHADYGLNIFDFDRCSDQLSNAIHVSLAPDTNRISGLALSGNSRFAYVTFLKKIFQFDLEAPDIAASKTLVATYDGFQSGGNSTDFYFSQLAPDGKIYICTYGPTYHLHTINQPDSAGLACQVLQHHVLLPYSHYAAVPYYPNYRLGASSEPCDSLPVSVTHPPAEAALRVYPNPASGGFFVQLPAGQSGQLSLIDGLGKVWTDIRVDPNETPQRISLAAMPPGLYCCLLRLASGEKKSVKIVVAQ